MDASGRNAIVTLLANLLSERLDEEQLAAAASVITQLGTTLGFLAAQRALDATRNLNAAQRQALSSDLAEDGVLAFFQLSIIQLSSLRIRKP